MIIPAGKPISSKGKTVEGQICVAHFTVKQWQVWEHRNQKGWEAGKL